MRNRWIVGLPAAGLATALALTSLSQTGRSPGADAEDNSGVPPPANIVAGHPDNRVGSETGGATISGGGPHQATANYSTISGGSANTAAGTFSVVSGGVENQATGSRSVIAGGRANLANGAASTIGGGYTNAASGDYSTVSGGWRNQATGYVSTIGGGWENIATGQVATISGGQYNTALAAAATVSGGWRNRAEGAGAMIPGGRDNIALGEYSLAAGRNANAQHSGAFIWSDSTETGFSSTAVNQFLIQAAGNVGIDTDSPHEKLTVAGNIAPARDGAYTLGSETTRWERIYLSEAVDYPGVLSATSGGTTTLQLDPVGNLQVAGTMTATQFLGDGSQLTGIQIGGDTLAPGSVTIDKLDLTGLDERYARSGDAPAAAVAAVPSVAPTPAPSSHAVSVDGEGNVGVGTPTPRARLHVAGQILIEGGEPGAGKVLTSDESGLAWWQQPAAGAANTSATRVEDNEQSPNFISGHPSNTVGQATIGATIGGGGRVGKANRVEGNFTTIGGGMGNEVNGPYSTIGGGFGNIVYNSGSTVGGGIGNVVSNWNVTVSGGRDNSASGLGATIGGGRGNIATNRYATIPGGYFNTAAGPGAAVGGGFANIADGFIATVPGGSQNEANGEYSMAAGRRAKAIHSGSFVWGDSLDEDIASTTSNQVVFRANGGVGINTAETPEALNVAGNMLARGIVFSNNFIFSAGGEPLVQIDDQGNLQVNGTVKAAGFDGGSMPLASTGTATQTDFALGPDAVGSDEIRDGSVQLRDLDMDSLDARYTKAGETVAVATASALPPIFSELVGLQQGEMEINGALKAKSLAGDGSELTGVTAAALADDVMIQPAQVDGVALTQTSVFSGVVSGTSDNLVLQDGAVRLQHLDLAAIDARYAKAGETSSIPVVAVAPTIEPNSIGSAELMDGSIQPDDLNLEALDQRYAKAGETSSVPVVAVAPTIEPNSIGSAELMDGSIQPDDLNLEALDRRYIQPNAIANVLDANTVFGGAVAGTATNLVLQDGAVQLQHLDLDALDQRFVQPDALAAATASALDQSTVFGGAVSGTASNLVLQDGAVQLQHIDLEAMDARYAKAGDAPAVQLENLDLEALDGRYITQAKLSAAAAGALAKTSEFGGAVSGTYTNIVLQDGAVQLQHLDLDALDQRFVQPHALDEAMSATLNTATSMSAPLPQIIPPNQVSGIALTQDNTFSGSVAGPFTNLQLQVDAVGSEHIRNGAVTVDDLDIETLDARYAELLRMTLPAMLPNAAAMPPALADALTIGPNGAATFSGTVAADSFEGYGAGLTGVIATTVAEGAVANDAIAEGANIDPAKIAGTALTGASEFAGQVQGTASNLVIAPQAVTLDAVDTGSLDQRYATVEALADLSRQAHALPAMITSNGLADSSVNTTHIQDGSVTAADFDRESTDAIYVKRDGDTLSGPLALPSGGLTVGEAELVVRDGFIGVGVAEPTVALDIGGSIRIAGGEPGEGKLLVSDHDGAARWAAPEELSLGKEAPDAEDVRYGSVFGPRVQQPLNLQVAGKRALRIEPTAVTPNLIGGSEVNTVKPRTVGATIAGGGSPDQPSRIDADFGAIGGGSGNLIEGAYGTIAGGWDNTADGARSTIGGGRLNIAGGAAATIGGGFTNVAQGSYATIGGGYDNFASGYVATVAGGWGNNATGTVSTIGGGQDNAATGSGATVAGGWKNRAEGLGATIPGGKGNTAKGEFSAALGLRAQALHDGAFVWSDSEDRDFASTRKDQFLIKARGNVGIDDNDPREKLTVKGNIAPSTHRRYNLGSDTARWETLYLGSTLDVANPLKITQNGKPILAISPEGDLNVPGTIIGKQFVGDGSELTNLPAQEIADGAIALKHLSKELADSLDRPAPDTLQVHSLTTTGTVTAARFVGDGSALTGIDTGKLKPATVADIHIRPDAAISPAKVKGIALTRDDQFGGSVIGPFNKLALRDGAVSMQHLGKDVTDALNKPAADVTKVDSLTTTGTVTAARFVGDGSALTGIAVPDPKPASLRDIHIQPDAQISPAKIKGIAVTRGDPFDGAVTGPFNKLALRDGAVSMQHLGKDVADALNKPVPRVSDLDPSVISGVALTQKDVFNGVVVGSMSNLHYRASSITGPAIADGAISLRHIDGPLLEELTPKLPDFSRMPELTVEGPLRAKRLEGDGSGLSNIPFAAITIPKGAVNADMLAPQSVYVENLAPGLAELVQREMPDLDRLTDLTLRGTLNARRLAGDGSAITGLQFSALTIPEAAITGDLIKPGSIGKKHLAAELAELGASGWLLGGNQTGGSRPSVLGTLNESPLHILVGGQPMLRLRPGATSPTFIGGHSSNTIDAGAEGSVISGGGAAGSPNVVAQRYGTIGGGINNQARNEFVTVGGGSGNVAAGFDATIAGGQDNQASGSGAMIGGGFTNVAAGSFSTIAGGAANRAAGNVAAIAGGYGNSATGSHAAVPGGSLNEASGDYSLAAGRRALARHPGSFVWADGSDTEIASTGANQFVVQASGGVRLLSDSAGRAGVQLQPGSGSWSSLSDRSVKENFVPVDPQQILAAVVALPLNSWNYTTQDPNVRHLGPTAQDFRAAFQLGTGDTHITAVDAEGVALAAIQGMHRLLTEKDERIQALEDENHALNQRIEKIEARLNNAKTTGGP